MKKTLLKMIAIGLLIAGCSETINPEAELSSEQLAETPAFAEYAEALVTFKTPVSITMILVETSEFGAFNARIDNYVQEEDTANLVKTLGYSTLGQYHRLAEHAAQKRSAFIAAFPNLNEDSEVFQKAFRRYVHRYADQILGEYLRRHGIDLPFLLNLDVCLSTARRSYIVNSLGCIGLAFYNPILGTICEVAVWNDFQLAQANCVAQYPDEYDSGGSGSSGGDDTRPEDEQLPPADGN